MPKVAEGVETPVESRKDLDKTCLLTPDLIYRAAAFLKTSLCDRIDGDYVAIVHPYVAYDLMRNEEWINATKYADPDKLYNGEIGELGGVRFVESSEAKIWNDDFRPEGLAVFSTLVLGAHAYAKTAVTGGGLETIVKPLGYGEDPLNRRSSVGWKATSAIKRLRRNSWCALNRARPGIPKQPRQTEKRRRRRQNMSNMVNIKVPTDPTDQSDLLVCLNGQRYLIQRGRAVAVPRGVAEVIEHAERQTAAMAYMDSLR